MHVQIELESPYTTWTNLDFIRGKVHLRLFNPLNVSSIVVKLEGEARTRLRAQPPQRRASGPAPNRDEWAGEKPVMREETHKVLYRAVVAFPENSLERLPGVGEQRHLTLPAGQHAFPFEFKFPFNNSCVDSSPASANPLKKLKGVSVPTHHVKKTLPPTLTAFPGLAEIKYYVKVTVNRKEFYKENPRVVQFLNFLPIEPPRDASTGAETYARRQHEFVKYDGAAGKQKKGLLNAIKKSSKASDTSTTSDLPVISADARLPHPAIITCNENLPLRIVVKRVNESDEPIFLRSIHIQLQGKTRIKAGEIFRDESSNWVILSKSNIGMAILSRKTEGSIETGEEVELDDAQWKTQPLPNSVAPSFETCNISRKYELEIQLGLGYGSSSAQNTIILPLRHPVQVYSGITPPPALLAAMASKTVPARKPVQSTPQRPEKSASYTAPAHLREGAPSDSAIPPTAQPGPSMPARPSESHPEPLPAGEEEPPPSYEDAIADQMPPVQGARRDYAPPQSDNEAGSFDIGHDAKGRRNS